jgi:hypothetical protein
VNHARSPRLPLLLAVVLGPGALLAGPYSAGSNNPANIHDAPVPGFVGPDGEGKARLDDGFGGYINARNFVNPLFVRWALGATNYVRADGQPGFSDPSLALGPVTGDLFDVLALGDLSATQIAGGSPVGKVTLQFTNATQTEPIRNLPGADFVVFENGLVAQSGTGGAGVGGVFAELAYVEVSSNGTDFARFPSVSLTPAAVGQYGTLDPTNIFNLAGKHLNGEGESWGTPFDLDDLTAHPLVIAGTVDLNAIRHVRIVDIPGSGAFRDTATPSTHAIYDPWQTVGSGGFDLEAIGAISVALSFEKWQDLKGLTGAQRGALADPDKDGAPNAAEWAFGMEPLVPDSANLPRPALDGTALAITFRRDTRTANATVEVLGTADLLQPWQTLARSINGAALAAVAPFAPAITDASESVNTSIGVIRRHRITAPPAIRFLTVRVTLTP